jgi:thiamine-phosphate pyrophosphorylase
VVLGRLHVIIDVTARSDPGAVVDLARATVGAGAPVVQLRAKGMTDAATFALAQQVQQVCAGAGATLLINDRTDIAVAVGAKGAHVGDEDLPVGAARAVLGPGPVLGATARTAAAALAAAAAGATYVGVGPCYATSTKVVDAALLGPRGLAAVANAVGIPVIAIAGVTASRVPELLAAGAYGVAVVGAVAHAPDPALATKELLAALGELP